jgi:hypothetical protein
MTRTEMRKNLPRNMLLSVLAVVPLLAFTEPAWAILGVWRRTAVTVAVVGSAEAANASKQAAATAQAQSAADASAAAAKQSAAAANQAAAAATTATAATAKTPQQRLQELQSLYDQKLISQSDYEAAKQKILSSVTN